jgi:protein-S-isoprenylcysteine O-methyltransferase Ste14
VQSGQGIVGLRGQQVALREDFETTGAWLFRWRSYLPLAMTGFVLLALSEYKHPGNSERGHHLWEMVCLIVSFLGLAIRVLTIGYTPRRTSGRNTKEQVADVLNTTGMYSVVRNPLYLGNFFMGLGIALFAHLWWLTLIYALAFWLYHERIIFAEEAFLRNKFERQFLEWADSTPVFVPKFSKYQKARLPFSWRNVLKKEYNAFFIVIVVMFIMETVGDVFAGGELVFDLGWLLLLCVGFIVWLTVRIIKKRTNLLNEEGR